MKVRKKVVNIIISFLLIPTILAIIVFGIIQNKLLNRDYIVFKLEETQFYVQISREIEEGFEKYIYQSGLPEDIIKDLFTEEIIKKDVTSIFDKVYYGTDVNLSDNDVKENLNNKINEYLLSQNIKVNVKQESNIEKFEKLIIDEYKENIYVSNEFYDKANEGILKLEEINNLGTIPIVILIILIVLLIINNRKDLLAVITYGGITLLSTAILIRLGTSLVFSNVDIDNLVILSTSLTNLIISILKSILYDTISIANVFMVSGIVSILITAFLNSKEENQLYRRFRK